MVRKVGMSTTIQNSKSLAKSEILNGGTSETRRIICKKIYINTFALIHFSHKNALTKLPHRSL